MNKQIEIAEVLLREATKHYMTVMDFILYYDSLDFNIDQYIIYNESLKKSIKSVCEHLLGLYKELNTNITDKDLKDLIEEKIRVINFAMSNLGETPNFTEAFPINDNNMN